MTLVGEKFRKNIINETTQVYCLATLNQPCC